MNRHKAAEWVKNLILLKVGSFILIPMVYPQFIKLYTWFIIPEIIALIYLYLYANGTIKKWAATYREEITKAKIRRKEYEEYVAMIRKRDGYERKI